MTSELDNLVLVDLVGLVDTMRQAQQKYFAMVTDRDGSYTQHQERRALQAAKTAEQRLDEWLARYHRERAAYDTAMEQRRTDEVPGQYSFNIHFRK